MTTRDSRIGARVTGSGPVGGDRPAAGKAASSANGRTKEMSPKAAAKGTTWSPMTAPFAGLAEAPMQWLSQAAEMMSPKAAETPAPAVERAGSDWMREAVDYWVDAAQRQILFWDVLRKRGNQALEHYRKGKPPVLVFELRPGRRRAPARAAGQLHRCCASSPSGASRPIRTSGRS